MENFINRFEFIIEPHLDFGTEELKMRLEVRVISNGMEHKETVFLPLDFLHPFFDSVFNEAQKRIKDRLREVKEKYGKISNINP